jgi:hypothetical protein
MPPSRIWDIHVHFPRNFRKPEEEPEAALAHMAMRLQETGVVKAGLLCPAAPRATEGAAGSSDPSKELNHERCIEMAAAYPDLFVPHAVVD